MGVLRPYRSRLGIRVAACLTQAGPALALVTATLFLVACGGHSDVSTSTSGCGSKPGVKATGTPIKLGAIVDKLPGSDFTDVPNMAAAYFACVNANGGVIGHPIAYEILTQQINPAQIAAAAHKLVGDGAIGTVGSISAIECTIDHAYWEHLGYYEIDAGYAPECYSTPNSAAANMGARYSSDGAVQYVIAHGAKKIVFDQANSPINAYVFAGPTAVADAAQVPITTIADNSPVQDANSIALRDVNAAGSDGAVVLDFPPPSALSILQAAQKLKLEDRVKLWGCATPCNADFVAKPLGPKWSHKLFVNAELLNPDTQNSPNMQLYEAILRQYGSSVSGGVGSFSQMGFAIGEITVHALESIRGQYTVSSVNRALKNVTDFDTGQLCRPWTYGDYPLHIPNNVDITVTPRNGRMVVAQGCTPISSADPGIAAYRKLAG